MQRNGSREGIREILLDDGSKSYEARINRTGERSLSKRFKTRKEALAWKRGIDSDIDRGRPVLNGKTVLVKTIIDDYLSYRAKSLKPIPSNQVTEYGRVKLDLGTFAISKLDRRDVENWLKLLLNEKKLVEVSESKTVEKTRYAQASVRKFYYAFKTAVDWHSAENRYHVSEFLFELVKGTIPPAWEGKRKRRLKSDEEERLYESGIAREDTYTREDWQGIIGFALETAMREQEIVYARWEDLRADNFKLYIPKEHSKTKSDRTVLLSGKAREIVKMQQANNQTGDDRIFFQVPSPRALCKAFGLLRDRAGINDLHFHDFRHEATSRLCERGKLNMLQIMEMTGHSSMTTFRGYLHLLEHENSVVLD